MRIRISKKIQVSIVCAYLLLISGSVLHKIYMSELQKINIVVTAICSLYVLCRDKNILMHYPRNCVSVFVLLAVFASVINMLIWGELRNIVGYIANISIILVAYYVSTRIDFCELVEKYINIIVAIASISLVLFYIPSVREHLPYIHFPDAAGGSSRGYDFYFVYTKFTYTGYAEYRRNLGIFWEPGMYQGFLIFAMLLIILRGPRKYDLLRQIILLATVISTGSTTGLLLLVPVAIIYLLTKLEKYGKGIRVVLTVFGVLFVVWSVLLTQSDISTLLPQVITEKLMDTGNISRNTRLYGILSDLILIIRHPLGIGNNAIYQLRASTISAFAKNVDSSVTNSTFTMMIMYGLIPGLLYLYICIVGGMNFCKDRFRGLIVASVILGIINTEPHYLCAFFTTIVFYGAQKPSIKESVIE